MKLWGGLTGAGQPATETKGALERRFSAGTHYAFQGTPYVPLDAQDVDRAVREQYGRVIWVYRAIDARARSAAGLTVQIKDGHGKSAKLIHNHPLDKLLNRRANKFEDAYTFRYRLHTLADLSKKGVFVEVLENRLGDPAQLVLLNPQHTYPVPHPDKFVERFEMRLPSGEVFGDLPPYEQGKGGVIWLKRPHPLDPYSSMTWLEAAGISIELDYYARLFNRNFMFNDGRPGGVLSVKPHADDEDGEIDPADAAALQARLQGGPAHAGKIAVWEGDLEYTDLSTSPRDAQYVESRSLTQREILVAAGTPLSVIGDASGRTFDNADAEEENFWRHTMRGELRFFSSGFEALTLDGDEGDDEVIHFDTSEIAVLQRDERARKAALDADYAGGRITLDEWREETGRDAIDVAGTRVIWQSAGKAPIGDDADVKELLTQGQEPAPPEQGQLPPGPAPLQIEGPPGDAPPSVLDGEVLDEPVADEEIQALLEGKAFGSDLATKVRPSTGPSAAYLARRRAEHDALLTEWEQQVAEAIRAVLTRQEAVVLSRLTGAKARKHTRHWTPVPVGHEVKALDPRYVLDRARWIGEIVAAVSGLIVAAFDAAGNAVLAQVESRETFSPSEAARQIVTRTVQAISESMDARYGKLQDVIATADEEGLPLDQIADRVRDAYQDSNTWSETTSRAVVGAMNAASLIGATQAGAVKKRWLATDDERTRPTHRAAEGQVVGIGDNFLVGDVELATPGDPTGGAATISEWIQCRCTMLFQLPIRSYDDELDDDLAALDALEGIEWKARGFRRAAASAAATFRVAWDPNAHARDEDGRFVDMPDVTLPDGSHGRAVSMDGTSTVVRRDDGKTETVDATRLGDPAATEALAAEAPELVAEITGRAVEPREGRKGTGDGEAARAQIPTVADLMDGGMDEQEAKAEWGRLYHNARFRIRRERIRKEKAELAKVTSKVTEDLPKAVASAQDFPRNADGTYVTPQPAEIYGVRFMAMSLNADGTVTLREDSGREDRVPAAAVKFLNDPNATGDFTPSAPEHVMRAVSAARRAVGDPSQLGVTRLTFEAYLAEDEHLANLRKRKASLEESAARYQRFADAGYNVDDYAMYVREGMTDEQARSWTTFKDPETLRFYREDAQHERDKAESVQADIDRYTRVKRTGFVAMFGEDGKLIADRAKDGGPSADTDRALSAVRNVGAQVEAEAQAAAAKRMTELGADAITAAQDDAKAAIAAHHDETEAWLKDWRATKFELTHNGYSFDEYRTRTLAQMEAEGASPADRFRAAGRLSEHYRDMYPDEAVDPTAHALWKERRAAARDLTDQLSVVNGKFRDLEGKRRQFLAEERLRVLSKIRPMGAAAPVKLDYFNPQDVGHAGHRALPGKELLAPMDKTSLHAAISAATNVYPTSWLNARDQRANGQPLRATLVNRGYALERTNELALSPDAPAWTGAPDMYGVAVHELGHHMEGTDGVKALEWAFHWSRTTTGRRGSRKRTGDNRVRKLSEIYPSSGYADHEQGSKDEFSTAYIGKVYMDDPTSSWEIFTMAAESLFAGSKYVDDDPDLAAFALGLIATL